MRDLITLILDAAPTAGHSISPFRRRHAVLKSDFLQFLCQRDLPGPVTGSGTAAPDLVFHDVVVAAEGFVSEDVTQIW